MKTIFLIVMFYSNYYGIDPALTLAVIEQESSFRSGAIGPHGEIGLMQLHPEYFNKYDDKKELFDINTNIRLGVNHLAGIKKRQKSKFPGKLWVICYNLGETGCRKLKNPAMYPYYQKIKVKYDKYKKCIDTETRCGLI